MTAPTATRRGRFARDTAVEPEGGGGYAATIHDGWGVLSTGAPNGGYLLAMVARACAAEVPDHPDPVTITGHYLSPATHGPVRIEVTVLRRGGRHATLTARMLQGGEERLHVIGTFTRLSERVDARLLRRPALDLPAPEDCLDVNAAAIASQEAGGPPAPAILQRFDHRVPATAMGWADGRPDGSGELGGWCRLADAEPVDTLALLVVADAYPPAVFNAGIDLGWVPTIELTVQIRKRPAPGWLATRFTTTAITGDYLEEDGEVRDAAGDLVVLSRQLALAPRR